MTKKTSFLEIFFVFLSLCLFLLGLTMIHILVSLIVSHISLKLCSYFFVSFLFVPHSWWFQFSYLQIHWYFFFPGEICCWALLVCFLFSHCTCHLQKLIFLLNSLYLFIDILIFLTSFLDFLKAFVHVFLFSLEHILPITRMKSCHLQQHGWT